MTIELQIVVHCIFINILPTVCTQSDKLIHTILFKPFMEYKPTNRAHWLKWTIIILWSGAFVSRRLVCECTLCVVECVITFTRSDVLLQQVKQWVGSKSHKLVTDHTKLPISPFLLVPSTFLPLSQVWQGLSQIALISTLTGYHMESTGVKKMYFVSLIRV